MKDSKLIRWSQVSEIVRGYEQAEKKLKKKIKKLEHRLKYKTKE